MTTEPQAAEPVKRFRNRVLRDFPGRLPQQRFDVIFDVGANVGQSTAEFGRAYPEARIWAFEPIAAAYQELVGKLGASANVTTVPAALGSRRSSAVMRSHGTSTGNRLVDAHTAGRDQEEVEVIVGDDFCAEHGIEHIDYLKVDAEGSDLDVLVGFRRLLAAGAVSVIQVEASTYLPNTRQAPLERFRGLLEPLGYHLFGFYGPHRDFHGLPVLARIDPVFISTPVIEENIRTPER